MWSGREATEGAPVDIMRVRARRRDFGSPRAQIVRRE